MFEATRALVCLTAKLAAVLAYDGYSYEPVTEANENLTGFQPLGPTANVDAALLLGFESALPFPGTDITLFVWSGAPERRDAPVACGLPASAAFAPATLRWEYWSGFEWAPLALMKDDSLAFTRTRRDHRAHAGGRARHHRHPAGDERAVLDPGARRTQPVRTAAPSPRGAHEHDAPHADGDRAARGPRRQQRAPRPGLHGRQHTRVGREPPPADRPGLGVRGVGRGFRLLRRRARTISTTR